MIELKDVHKDFINGDVVTKVLHGVSLKIGRGEFLAIMGPSGSGKSTLMHILGFLDTLSSGQYFFNNKDVSSLDDDTLAQYRNKKVGFVFQSFNLLPKTTVWENVRLPLLYSNEKMDSRIIDEAIKSVGLEHRRDHLSNQLSGGEKQRVAIARALVNKPDIIFADEPTGNLDSKSGIAIMSILAELSKVGKTVVLVTHESTTARYANRIITIRDGLIVGDDKNTSIIRTEEINGQLK
ncbi:MAG: macrolide ABC transporter ATP-binding protein [Candidatus Komeilibacteria bacterium RIFOXYC1_FULL_37_11]|uniref:Macrolide ABC transporter ATP-binding protein n=1 Tax=Candidatus Komeilibacteria bacterium RIFOXYC1_FULL_37_11 TaxID=1798555 RepID=A0A1G2BWZ2_9BACT|nr:MAG: macrolide ABC transporter ATP-binding protein [Candidatus Komeilibacteria bacterium RIFOXYC1_FULL_37_11]OGY95412.1 MAG: macrolide ABC transporter ATP-binding protein [Candidatus Komeilibacteria bacterium RIFOXYD1_FULL_37_29]OGY96832.1 MAG: macrolide ABC transporter ATP-binding protein [Candidatus Komeilibacteria bacterium RIFOXYD2_FULL_37_8]